MTKTKTAKPDIKKLLAQAKRDQAKRQAVAPGRQEVALALAAATKLSASAAAKVMDRPFSDPKIGLKGKAGMTAFKKSLASLLPAYRDVIEKIPGESSLRPAEVAAMVQKLVHAAAAEPLGGAPAVYVKPQSAESRTRCENALGKNFAQKASDRMIQAITVRMASGPREAAVNADQRAVMEFDGPIVPAPAAVPGREAFGARERLVMVRGTRMQQIIAMRENFYKLVSPMRAQLERALARDVLTFRESAQDLGSVSEVCWLNGTMRTVTAPKKLADVAADPNVKRLGIPRALERELNVTAKTVRALQFRTANSVSGRNIQIAVIDGEVDATHPSLAGRILQKKNYSREPWGHPDGHGTAVAGIIASAGALAGMGPAASISSYKLFPTVPDGLADDFQGGVAIQQALEDGAMIANCSWGNGLATDGTSRLARAFDSAWDLGLILVKSAGNGGPGAGTMTSPADARGVIVVGATNRQGTRLESYSSRGPVPAKAGPDLLAPGGSPNDFVQSLIPGNRSGRVDCGTSFAAPHITGLIALLLEQDPNATPDQIKAKLAAQAKTLKPNLPAECGAGLVRL